MVNATQFLTVLLQTHEWAQYAHQQVGCMRSPALYSHCDQVYRGSGIADINRHLYFTSYYPMSYVYAYTSVPFGGWQQANFTALSTAWQNATKIAVLSSCAANATCRSVYADFPSAKAVLTQYVAAAVQNLSQALPPSGNKTWMPGTLYANALGTWTSLIYYGSEVFGVHDLATYGAMNSTNVTALQMEQAKSLQLFLNGGAEMVETVLNYIAFRFYNYMGTNYNHVGKLVGYNPALSSSSLALPSSSTRSASSSLMSSRSTSTSSKSSSSSPTSRSASSSTRSTSTSTSSSASSSRAIATLFHAGHLGPTSPNRKFDDLYRISTLRGTARKAVAELRMENYLDLLQSYNATLSSASPANAAASGECSTGAVIKTIKGMLTLVSDLCSAYTIATAFMDIQKMQEMEDLSPLANAMRMAGHAQLDTVSASVSAVSILCSIPGMGCFPGRDAWNFDLASGAVTVLGAAVVLAEEGSFEGIAVNIACMAESWALQAYSDAETCCEKDCYSPSCKAASIACTYGSFLC